MMLRELEEVEQGKLPARYRITDRAAGANTIDDVGIFEYVWLVDDEEVLNLVTGKHTPEVTRLQNMVDPLRQGFEKGRNVGKHINNHIKHKIGHGQGERKLAKAREERVVPTPEAAEAGQP